MKYAISDVMHNIRRVMARLQAVQSLYLMDITGKGARAVLEEFDQSWKGQLVEGVDYSEVDAAFCRRLVAGVLTNQVEIDRLIERNLEKSWTLVRLDSVLRAILRAGVYELKYELNVPLRVIIKEYADLTAGFLDESNVGVANGILDTIGHDLRPAT